MSTQNLDIVQSQRTLMHLSPQQVQFVRMLEMNTAEIEEKVRRELDDNPALESVDNDTPDISGQDNDMFNESPEQLMAADYRSEEEMPFTPKEPASGFRDYNSNALPSLEINAHTTTPTETLLEQLGDFQLSDNQRIAAVYIIGSLDSNGRITRSLSAIADDITIATGKEIPEPDINVAFETVRKLEPPGVGAVDLRDCMLLQLERRQPSSLPLKTAVEIVRKHFNLLSHKHYDRMLQLTGVDSQTFKAAINIIKSLNPKPLSSAESETNDRMRHIIPDFGVEPLDNGRFSVWLTQRIPTLDIERSFRPENATNLNNRNSESDNAFIKSRRDEARQFIDMLDRRRQTLLDVMQAIVTLQQDFFATDNPATIKPMILKDVAAITGLGLSVISRAAAGKYVATQAGVYPLKMFFNERPKDDDDTSSHKISASLSALINTEDGENPYSDQQLTELMNEQGFDIARRTVAKYRERLGFPVARLRKKI